MGLPVDLRGSQPEPDAAGDRPPSQYLPVRRPCFTAGAGNADFDSGILLRQTGELRCVWWPARTEGGVSWGPARGALERAAQCFRRGALSGRQHRVAGVVSSHLPRAEQPDLLRVVAPGDRKSTRL